MIFFPFALIDYAKTLDIPIGWNDYLAMETPPVGYLPEGNIAFEKAASDNEKASPEYETWKLFVVIRDPDFTVLTGTAGLVDKFTTFIKGLRKTDISPKFSVEDIIFPIVDEDVLTGDNYFYYVNEITFKVINKSKR